MPELRPDALAERLRRAPEKLGDAALQGLLAALIHEYARRVEGQGDPLAPLPAQPEATATDVIVTVTELLKAADVAVFELGMWQALGRR